MFSRFDKVQGVLDITLVASLATFFAVLVNRPSFSSVAYTILLTGLLAGVTLISVKRESRKERLLDEMQLASVSFGSRWALAAIVAVIFLFLFATPLQDAVGLWFERVQDRFQENGGKALSPPAALFWLGMVTTMTLYLVARSLLAAIWTWRKR
jgi:hypothetical protein